MSNDKIDTRMMAVIGAIRQSITNNAGPGTSVNTHPNPFFLSVIGAIDMRSMAELVLKRIDELPVEAKADPETAASVVDGR